MGAPMGAQGLHPRANLSCCHQLGQGAAMGGAGRKAARNLAETSWDLGKPGCKGSRAAERAMPKHQRCLQGGEHWGSP